MDELDDEQEVAELMNLSIGTIIQVMSDKGESEFGLDVEFADAKLCVRITLIEGTIN